jgi:hypothetical protein
LSYTILEDETKPKSKAALHAAKNSFADL